MNDNQTLTVGTFKQLFKEMFTEMFKEQFKEQFKEHFHKEFHVAFHKEFKIAIQDELKGFATKEDLKRELSAYATKEDLKQEHKNLKKEIEGTLFSHFHTKAEIDKKLNEVRRWTVGAVDNAAKKFEASTESYRKDFHAAVDGYQNVFENYENLQTRVAKLELQK